MAKVFINYRRVDSKAPTSRLAKELKDKLGEKEVFIDESDMEAGVWSEQLEEEISNCKAFVVVIGKQWHSCQNPDTGIRRISDPDDVVRREIELALQHKKQIILLCVDGAPLPPRKSLKDDPITKTIEVILDYQKFDLDVNQTPHRYSADLDKLIEAIQKITPTPSVNAQTTISSIIISLHLGDQIKSLISYREENVRQYANTIVFIWSTVIESDVISNENAKEILVLTGLHSQLILCWLLVKLQRSFCYDVTVKDALIIAGTMSSIAAEQVPTGGMILKKRVNEILEDKDLIKKLQEGVQFSSWAKFVPPIGLQVAAPLAYKMCSETANAYNRLYGRSLFIRPIDEDINKVTAEELLERIAQVEAELEKLISTSDK